MLDEVEVITENETVLEPVVVVACRATGRLWAQATDTEPKTTLDPSRAADHIFN